MSIFMKKWYRRMFRRNAPIRPLRPLNGYTGNSLSILSHTQRQVDQHAKKLNPKEN